MRTRGRLVGAFLIVCAMGASSCGDSKESGSDSTGTPTTGVAATATTTVQPRSGGQLTFAAFQEPLGLDPIVSTGRGTSGGNERLAIYDTLLKLDPVTRKYEPRLAQSVEPNSDSSVWTIKVRPGVKFSDGTPLDADAVKFGLERHRVGQAGGPPCEQYYACPRNANATSGYMAIVQSIDVVDALTVQVRLSGSFADFRILIADEVGLIPSPAAIKKACDPTKPIAQCPFNLSPVGAGPFMIESFKSKEAITMVRNPTYWDGPAYLDSIKFVTAGDGGSDKTYDLIRLGNAQAGFLFDDAVIAKAKKDGMAGLSYPFDAKNVDYFNLGVTVTCAGGQPAAVCAGKPDGATQTNPATKALKVRQAVAAAYDPAVLSARVWQGGGRVGSQMFTSGFPWYAGVEGPKYDPAAARRLVQEAKAEGWNGKIRYLCSNTPSGMNRGLAVQAMLGAVGMEVSVDTSKDTASIVRQYGVDKDFDIACSGLTIPYDDGAPLLFSSTISSKSASNRTGWNNPKVDAALNSIRQTSSDTEKTAGYKVIAEEYARDLPFYVQVGGEQYVAHNDKVQGLQVTAAGMVSFAKAFIKA